MKRYCEILKAEGALYYRKLEDDLEVASFGLLSVKDSFICWDGRNEGLIFANNVVFVVAVSTVAWEINTYPLRRDVPTNTRMRRPEFVHPFL